VTTADAMTLKNLAGARVGVVGAGRTGLAVIDALDDLGARVHLLDARPGAADAVTAPLERVTIGDGGVQADALDETRPDLLVVSPGVPATGPVLTRARASGREVWSEIELAWRLQQARRPDVPWIVVTGTDGKTTTVGMLAAVLSAAGLNAPAVGNIGSPTITAVLEDRADVMAVELSSFQLHTTGTLSPLAAACLNLAPDHLDWHGGLEAYAADKARVYARTRRAAVYNTADAATRRMVEQADVAAGCLAVGFTLAVPGLGQVGVVEDLLVDRALHAGRRSAGLPLASLVDLAHLAPGGEIQEAMAEPAGPYPADPRLLRALDVADGCDVVSSVVGGLDGWVAERGRSLSGGQRQRVALARALAVDPAVLVLVEPTSAVDSHTEARIAGRLAAFRRGRTSVVVTGSPLVLAVCDEVVFVVGGVPVLRGSHRQLLTDPAYQATVHRGEGA